MPVQKETAQDIVRGKSPESSAGRTNGESNTEIAVNQLLSKQQKLLPRPSAETKAPKLRRKLRPDEQQAFRRRIAQPAHEVLLDPAGVDPHLVALQDSEPTAAAEQFSKLAVVLLSIAAKRFCKRMLIASAQPTEGRTYVLLSLAQALARARQRVLVIESDFHRPSISRMLGIDVGTGIAEVCERDLSPGAAVVRVLPADFDVMIARSPILCAADLLASPAFRWILDVVDEDYDFVLFDSPPLLESTDVHLLMQFVEGVLLVIQPGRTSADQMAKAVAAFSQSDLCGVVLNRIEP